MMKLSNKKGFTLVEMIVVIAIIGILIALIAPNMVTLIQDATETVDDATAKTIQGSANAWGVKNYKDGNAVIAAKDKINGTDYYCLQIIGKTTGNGTFDGTNKDAAFYDLQNQTAPLTYPHLYGPKDNDYIALNALKKGYKYYVFMTKKGACGGVIVCDNTDQVLGLTKQMPLEISKLTNYARGNYFKFATGTPDATVSFTTTP